VTPFQLHVKNWKDCQRCELGCQRDKIVLARGVVPCDVLFIGEAPGASEDVIGQPFVGPAGKLLDHLVNRAGFNEVVCPEPFLITEKNLPRPMVRVAFTNLVACFPKEQKASGDNEPPEKAIKACRNRLAQFIKVCQPQLVVCVGKLSSKWVQTFRAGLGLDEVKLVHIVHPAGILRANEAQQGLMRQRVMVQLANALQQLVSF
jgi:DNA polymerase